MPLAAGTRLGPYQITGSLGAGGMGEVYRGHDPRLSREVAIKVLPAEMAHDPDRLARFDREARAIAALNHPHILTIFDVGTDAGVPYVVTELLDGQTWREVVEHRTLTPRQVLQLAGQAAQGLAAAHAKGLVHRDLKPENLFLTTDGRVKILDFGLAKQTGPGPDAPTVAQSNVTQANVIVGTLAYLAPEQVQAQVVDARADVFAFGVVLYEMLTGRHPFRRDTVTATLAAILQDVPAPLEVTEPALPAAAVIVVRRCLAKRPDDRHADGHALARALEEALQVPAGATLQELEERRPYPGLQSFTERDASVFFGREAEVAALWARIRTRPLLAVIGPSGAGKTSFLRAGVIPARPEGWATIVCTPGTAPLRMLGQALAPELGHDVEALRQLVAFDDPEVAFTLLRRWRHAHAQALVVVDQFEELFTLNAAEVQARVTALLGRLVAEADLHVVLSLRDDFLMRCHEHPALAPVFVELTPLGPLTRDSLRRAVVEPAKKRGYRVEDDALVDEMVDAVEGARAALPLLAFAVAQLWEWRDREQHVLTRAAYEAIGGVAGALAQHAEATLDRVGSMQQDVVRELFRNLVTAQGTRAVIDRDELLSAFPDRVAAEGVLRTLVDARLLTEYEVEGEPGEPSRARVEIAHESLLKAWPRLVRWQTQDEEGAQLRDQLKQAAHLWEERNRSADLLWSGTAFQEYTLWRERYPGALTALEEAFARAMAEKARRRTRLLWAAVTSVIVALAAFATIIGISRQQALEARDEARVQALRAEAGKLLALGQTYLEDDPTAALAYARASLDLFDTREGRLFALEALWRGPVARILPLDQVARALKSPEDSVGTDLVTFSPDGRWLAAKSEVEHRVLLFPDDGGTPRPLSLSPDRTARVLAFGPGSDLLITSGSGRALKYWSVPDLREIRTAELEGLRTLWGHVRGEKFVAVTQRPRDTVSQVLLLPDGYPKVLAAHPPGEEVWDVHPQGTQALVTRGRTIGLHSLDGANRLRVLGQTAAGPWDLAYSPRGDLVASTDTSAETRLWATADGASNPVRILKTPEQVPSLGTLFDPQGRRVSAGVGTNGSQVVWDLEDLPDAQPLVVGRPGPRLFRAVTWDPAGQWLVTGAVARSAMEFWPVSSPRRRVLPGFSTSWFVAFTPDGRWLAHCVVDKPVHLWPLNARAGAARDLVPAEPCVSLAVHPSDGSVAVATSFGPSGSKVLFSSIPAGPERLLADRLFQITLFAFDPQGRRLVGVPFSPFGPISDPASRVLRVWELPSGRERVHSLARLTDADWIGYGNVAFGPDGLYVGGQGGVRRLSLPAEPGGAVTSETVYEAPVAQLDLSRDRTHLLVLTAQKASGVGTLFEEMLLLDLAGRKSHRITTHGARLSTGRLSPSGQIVVTGDHNGVVRVGPATGEEPHLLIGHQGPVSAVAVSPDERWIASVSDESISIWPMPDVKKRPLHTLPPAELLAKLDALTNLRVVRDPASPTGYRLDVGPFPGWKDVPTW